MLFGDFFFFFSALVFVPSLFSLHCFFLGGEFVELLLSPISSLISSLTRDSFGDFFFFFTIFLGKYFSIISASSHTTGNDPATSLLLFPLDDIQASYDKRSSIVSTKSVCKISARSKNGFINIFPWRVCNSTKQTKRFPNLSRPVNLVISINP